MIFGLPHGVDYFLALCTVFLLCALYLAVSNRVRAKQQTDVILAQRDAQAAQAHADNERMISLLAQIRDRLDRRP